MGDSRPDPVTGKTQRKHLRGRTKAEVAEKVRTLEADRDAGLSILRVSTVKEWSDYWMSLQQTRVRPSTMSGYRTDRLHIDPVVGTVRLRDLRAEHVERHYAAVLAAGCTAGSVMHVRRTLSAGLNAARKRGHIVGNPVTQAQVPTYEPA